MMDRHLHIVAHDVPLPSDSGILKELIFLIKALHDEGIKVHLHIFGKSKPESLIPFCHEFHVYPKKQGHEGYTLTLPYAVSSRSDMSIVNRLGEDSHPILFAGLKTVSPILDAAFKNERKIVVRLLRDEQTHFRDLTRLCSWGSQKIFYAIESFRFGRLMKKLSAAPIQYAVSSEFPKSKIESLNNYTLIEQLIEMPFVIPQSGIGNFCLYHGNLGKTEHIHAANWLLQNVFNKLEIPFVITGDNPSDQLEKAAHEKMHTCLVANPSEKELHDLIKKAQINIFTSFVSQCNTGLVYQTLAMGRHVLTNVSDTCEMSCDSTCYVAEGKDDFISKTRSLFKKSYDGSDHNTRASFLNGKYNNQKSVSDLIRMLY